MTKVLADSPFRSFRRVLLFWLGLLLVIQEAARLFLLPEALSIETPSTDTIVKTLITGFRADLITATMGVLAAAFLAWISGLVLSAVWSRPQQGSHPDRDRLYRHSLIFFCSAVAILFVAILTVNMGYYYYNHQYLDFVFFEHLDELFSPGPGQNQQAALQTGAELQERTKWGLRLGEFLALESIVGLAWWACFKCTARVNPYKWVSSNGVNLALIVGLGACLMGFHPYGPWSVLRAGIPSGTYYLLAQNPLWLGTASMVSVFTSRLSGTVADMSRAMPLEEAVEVARDALAPGATFPYSRYPFVREALAAPGVSFNQPANVLLIFVEGLDRRYLGRTVDPERPADFERWFIYESPQQRVPESQVTDHRIRLTPFLDRLKHDSLYFENFFTNGTQTARGLFASLCSYYPRQGAAVMKTRYMLEYLCLPSLLRKAGYTTEMVIGQNRDRNFDNIGLFLTRNGLDQFFDESDFPANAEKLGIGMTDGALFDFLRGRIGTLQKTGKPFFLTTLTVATHHPYTVPTAHPDVQILQRHADKYVAALRHLDLELERLFATLQRDGLLKNTVVFVLGDHGRHHGSGRTETERWAGHFTAPLYIWLDPSLRTAAYRPRIVRNVASQVDLQPTILAMNGLTPPLSPSLGRDLSCLLARDCVQDNFAFLSSVYDDVIGLADQGGIWFYSFRDRTMYQNDLQFNGPGVPRTLTDPDVASRYRLLLGLYISSNMLLEQNRIWSWKEFGPKL